MGTFYSRIHRKNIRLLRDSVYNLNNIANLIELTGNFSKKLRRRAYLAVTGRTMSRFNTDPICLACAEAERRHPDYAKAVEAELAALKAGDRNFPGIGLPPDLARRP